MSRLNYLKSRWAAEFEKNKAAGRLYSWAAVEIVFSDFLYTEKVTSQEANDWRADIRAQRAAFAGLDSRQNPG